MTRTCDLYGINDCQTANGIKYCYCNANRCNGKAATATIDDDDANTEKSHPIDHRRNPILREADDEDYADDDGDDDIEASGLNEAIDDALPIELTTITTTTSTHATQMTTTTMKTTSNKSTIPMSAASPPPPPPPPSQSSPHSRINHTATGTTISTTSTRTVANTTSIGDNILTTANPTLDVRSSASNVTIKIVISSLSSMLIFWRALA